MSHHFYFTNPTLSADGGRGLFVSYRSGYPNLFAIDLASGEVAQITDRADINPFSPAPSRRDDWVYFSARDAVHAVDSRGGEPRPLSRFPGARLGNCSLNSSGSLLAIGVRHPDHCELALVETASGRMQVLHRAAEVGHIQFCPNDDHLLLYSGTPRQRLWVYDRRQGQARCLYDQAAGEWFVHESWLGAGPEIIFSHWPHALKAIRADGAGVRTVAAVNAWHACSDRAGARIVCDTNHPDRGLLLIDPATGAQRPLCHPRATQRGTQWLHSTPAAGAGIDTSIIRGDRPEDDRPPHPDDPASVYGPQWSHPHPTFTADGSQVIFTSDRDRWSQVYSVEVSEAR